MQLPMYEVTLNTKSGPLGLGLASMPTGADRGAIVETLGTGGLAQKSGLIEVGHILVRIGDKDCSSRSFKGCMGLLKKSFKSGGVLRLAFRSGADAKILAVFPAQPYRTDPSWYAATI